MTGKEEAFLELSTAVRRLFHLLREAAAAAAPSDDGLMASHRGVMESLALHGPQTVPALARARPVARQHIQVLVNELLALGLVHTRPNPAHKRSSLVALTAAGVRRFDAIRRAEGEAIRTMRFSLPVAQLRAAAADLRVVSEDLAQWLAAFEKSELSR